MTVELRKNKRFPSHLPARILIETSEVSDNQSNPGQPMPATAAVHCTVVDYSHSGIRLHGFDQGVTLTDKPVTLEIVLSEPASILVDVVYQQDDFIGLKIHEPSDQLFLEIQEYTHLHGTSRDVSQAETDEYRTLMIDEARMLSESLPARWSTAFSEATGPSADKAKTTDEHQQWMLAARKTQQHRAEFIAAFGQRVQQQLERWTRGEAKKTEEESRSETIITLSLVHQKDFEDWLRTKVTVSHLQANLARREFEVKQYFQAVFPGPDDLRFNPIDPVLVTEAFRDGMPVLELPRPCRELAFSVFEKVALEMLNATYAEILDRVDIPLTFLYRSQSANAARGDHITGAEPASDRTPEQLTPSETIPAQDVAPEIPDNLLLWPGTAQVREQAQQSYSSIGQLLSLRPASTSVNGRLQSDTGNAGDETSVALPLATEAEVLAVVNALAETHEGLPDPLLSLIDAELQQQDKRLADELRDAISTLKQITSSLLDNPELADFMKPSIHKVSWPLLRLVLRDAAALFNAEHPARSIITVIGELGRLTLVGHGQLQQEITQLLEPLCTAEIPEPALFNDVLEQLKYLLDSAERRVRQNTERVAQAAEGEYQIHRARQNVKNLLGQDVSDRALPQSVVDWLYDGWQQMLTIHWLREGPDSEAFEASVQLYRDILDVFAPQNRGQSKLLQSFIPMAEQARAELDALNGTLPEHLQWYRHMLTSAGTHLSGGQLPEMVEMQPYQKEEDVTSRSGKGSRRVQSLQTGDRLQIRETGQVVSIAWIADDHSRLACVNHTGLRVHDFRFDELSELMDKDEVRRLYEQEESTLDQSIDSLVQQIYSDLSRQANTDPLTGLVNRAHFIHLLNTALHLHNHQRTPLSLVLFDIHQLRVINQSYGLRTGDACLKIVAEQLQEQFAGFTCSRISDSSYALLLPGEDIERAESLARQFIEHAAKQPVETGSDLELYPAIKGGVTMLTPETSDGVDLLEQAQSACNEAVAGSASSVVRYQYQHSPRDRYREFTAWRERMERALQTETLSLLMVPVEPVQLRNKSIIQYEAICQLPEGPGGQIPPDEVRYSNSGGFQQAYDMDCWMVRRLTHWLRDHETEADGIRRFILKISGQCLINGRLTSYLRHQLETYSVPVNKFCFELNEASIRGDLSSTAEHMHDLRSLGCQFVLSEFGTGQASYRTLKALPVDMVRIDRNLIEDLHTSSADYALVKSIQEIARFMAKKTIAEHTGNDLAWDILRGIGVDFSSGALSHARPLQELQP